ncbi:hypothetical protein ABK905_03595 [Acerihabitans sp. KWT182]|uniref:Phosphotriesterase-related protein n=1 Tax=Acerihabitans sp. KWT182 TaxID=3157919 RepID=A0AAU7QAU8_9GAMM
MISEYSGVNIIGSTGNFLAEFNEEELRYASVDEIAARYISDIEEGVGDQKIKAGQIKCATSLRVIHPVEYKTLDASVIAQKKTNAPIWVHHGGILGVEIAHYLESKGADLSKVILGHTDRNPDHYEHLKIAKTGINLSVDNLARVVRYPVQENIDVIKNLLDNGFLEHIFISADFGRYTYYKSYGGGPGLEYILGTFVPRLQEQLGLSQAEIETLFVHSPQRVFCQF